MYKMKLFILTILWLIQYIQIIKGANEGNSGLIMDMEWLKDSFFTDDFNKNPDIQYKENAITSTEAMRTYPRRPVNWNKNPNMQYGNLNKNPNTQYKENTITSTEAMRTYPTRPVNLNNNPNMQYGNLNNNPNMQYGNLDKNPNKFSNTQNKILNKAPVEEITDNPHTSSCSQKYHTNVLDWHNYFRPQHHVGPLRTSLSLQQSAQDFAYHLAKNDLWEHSKVGQFRSENTGENLFVDFISENKELNCEELGKNAINRAYDEGKSYDFVKSGYSMETGQFTQVIWKETKEVGCALAKSTVSGRFYGVCHYYPAGNYKGRFRQNVLPI